MEKILVMDANVLVSALIKGEFTLQLINIPDFLGRK